MKPSTLKCLQLLRAHESVTTHDFLIAGCGSRFGGRLHELRHEFGCVIDEHRLTDRSGSRYTLVAEPDFSKPAGVTGSSGQATRADSVTAIPERNMVVEKPCPPVPRPQLSLLDGMAA